MTKDSRLHRLVPSGQPKFVRPNAHNKTPTQAANTDTNSNPVGKHIPTSPDSGFSDGLTAVPSTNQNRLARVERSGYANGGDFGTSSVIHVLQPDVSAGREWWHTRGYSSDPYVDGSVPVPITPRSEAALEAQQAAKKTAEVKAARLKLQNASADSSLIEPLLQTVPIRPTESREGPRSAVASPSKYEPSISQKRQPTIKSSPQLEKPPSKILLKRSTSLPINRNAPKVSTGVVTGRRSDSQVLLEIAEGDEHSPAHLQKAFRPSHTKSNKIITPPHRPAAQTRLKQSQPLVKGTSRSSQDITSNRLTERERDRGPHKAGPRAKRPRPSSTPVKTTSDNTNTVVPVRRPALPTKTQHTGNQPPTPPKINNFTPQKQPADLPKPKVISPRSSTTILVKRQQRYFSVPSHDEANEENEGISKQEGFDSMTKVDGRVKGPRKVSFITGTTESESEKRDKAGNMAPEGTEPVLSKEPKRRQRRIKMGGKKGGQPMKPTQRQMDNDFICDVALANRFSRMESRDKGDNQVSQVLSESEDEGEDTTQITKAKSCWELFEDQVKSIDDSSMYFSPRDLTSKSSDLFEKVMWQVGPQFRKTNNPVEPQTQNPQEEDALSGDEDVFNVEAPKIRGPISAMSRFKTRRGWGLLRKTVLNKQMESKEQGNDASFNWSMLCTTINHMTDMQKGREVLYQKYIYEPNTWMKGFTNLPTHVLKHSLRSSTKPKEINLSLRGVQSANSQRTVVVGHQEDNLDPNNQPLHPPHGDLRRASKARARSSQGRIRVAPHKPTTTGASHSRK